MQLYGATNFLIVLSPETATQARFVCQNRSRAVQRLLLSSVARCLYTVRRRRHGGGLLELTDALQSPYRCPGCAAQDEALQVVGAVVEDQQSGKRHEVHARVIINAAGPFSDSVRLPPVLPAAMSNTCSGAPNAYSRWRLRNWSRACLGLSTTTTQRDSVRSF